MKTKTLTLIGLLLSLTSSTMAQQNIEQAFKVLHSLNCITSKNSMVDRDPVTNATRGMKDVAYFTVSKGKKQIISKIEQAFEKDKDNAYTMDAGITSKTKKRAVTLLVVGENDNVGEYIGAAPNTTYVYSCFLDPQDETKTHRYAYALEYRTDGKKIKGKIVKTYGTTSKVRQAAKNSMKKADDKSVEIVAANLSDLPDMLKESLGDMLTDNQYDELEKAMSKLSQSISGSIKTNASSSSADWLGSFGIYYEKFTNNPAGSSASFYVSEIYGLCKNAKVLSDSEKNIVATQLDDMKKMTDDKYQRMLFDAAIEALKE